MSDDDHAASTASIKPRPESRRDDLYRADFSPDMTLRETPAEGESGPPILTGHFARFNEWTEINSIYEGRFMERIAPGAFKKTFQENAQRMRVLFNHGKDVLGNQILGPIKKLEEDKDGARYEVELFDGIPPLIMDGLRAGQYGASFRFKVLREEFDEEPKRSEGNPDGLPERTIKEAQVKEFGPVTFGAYAGATSGIRSMTDEFVVLQLLEHPERAAELLASKMFTHLPLPVGDDHRDDRHNETEEEVPAPAAARADIGHSTTARREPLYGLDRKETPSWQL